MMKDDNGATIQWIEDNPVYALGAWVSPCFPPTALQGKIKDKWLVNMGPPLCALRRLTYSASDRGLSGSSDKGAVVLRVPAGPGYGRHRRCSICRPQQRVYLQYYYIRHALASLLVWQAAPLLDSLSKAHRCECSARRLAASPLGLRQQHTPGDTVHPLQQCGGCARARVGFPLDAPLPAAYRAAQH